MQDYYYVLGITPTATALEIELAYVRARTRLKRRPAADPIFKAQLAEVEVGYDILGNPRRRIAYDILLADEPPAPPIHPSHHPDERLLDYARVGRRLNVALLAICLLLALDWALPLRKYAHETVRSRVPVAVSSPLSDPKMDYRVHTEHTTFRVPSAIGYRVRANQYITVWKTPLLGMVRRVSAPASPDGPAPFQPYEGSIYGTFSLLPLLLAVVAAVGSWPRRPAELVVNTAVVSGLLAVLTLSVLLWF